MREPRVGVMSLQIAGIPDCKMVDVCNEMVVVGIQKTGEIVKCEG